MPKQPKLDPTAMKAWKFICRYQQEHGYAPAMKEIADAIYVTRAGAMRVCDRLEARGCIYRTYGVGRGIAILKWPKGFEPDESADDV